MNREQFIGNGYRIIHRLLFWALLFSPLIAFTQNGSFDERVQQYIRKYHELAVGEMKRYRIPASITLAQGIYETNAGTSELAVKANNHFGIKCHKDWQGKTFIQDDESKNECFRKYASAEESYRDHSLFLSTRDRYKGLFELKITDYKGWAVGLKTAGYATNPHYPEKLIGYIEKYRLDRFDRGEGLIAVTEPVISETNPSESERDESGYEVFATGPGNRSVYLNNGLQFILLSKSDNLRSVAVAFGVSEAKILKWNDLKKGSRLATGQMVYLEPKKKRGASDIHYVRQGETPYTISQREGIRLNSLNKRNGLKTGAALSVGQVLLLR